MINRLKKAKIVRQLYSLIPQEFRINYKYYLNARKLITSTEFLSKEQLQNFQLKKMRQIVNYAWNNIDGYRDIWQKNKFHPDQIKSLEDIKRIPFVTKEILRENLDRFTNKNIKSLQYATTGGSTGIPFGFYQQAKNRMIEMAFIHDMWSRHYKDISLKTKSVILRGSKVEGIYQIDERGLILSSYDINLKNVKKYIELIEEYRYPIFQAYASAISLMAKIMKENDLTINHKFKLITIGSEPLYDFQKMLIQGIFHTKLSHWYGHTEKTVLAGNCEKFEKFHVYPQYGITEIIKSDGDSAGVGEVGEIVGTSFWNYATPFIRYRTMDFAEAGECSCKECGRKYQLLNNIEGRLQDFVINSNKEVITLRGFFFVQDFNAFSNIRQMQIVQSKVGEIDINIIPTENFRRDDEMEIIRKIESVSNHKIVANVNLVQDISRTKTGKLRFLDQRLDTSKYTCLAD
jgi:phenylacetate-CoA ligase